MTRCRRFTKAFRRMLALLLGGSWLALSGLAAAAGLTNAPPASPFDAANRLTAEGKFAAGAAAYDALATGGQTSPALEYNRAQARLKAGQIGSAWAHLRLAQRLAPRDSAIRLAVEQVAPRVPGGGSSSGAGRWLGWLTLNEWAVLALAGMWIWGGLLLTSRWVPGWSARARAATWITGGCALLASALLVLAAWSQRQGMDTIVLRPDTTVRVSPLDEARTAFSLAEGAEVRRGTIHGDWLMIEEPVSRRFGWVKQSDVFLLPFR